MIEQRYDDIIKSGGSDIPARFSLKGAFMDIVKLAIDRVDGYTLQIYRARSAEEIDTIEKVRLLSPVFEINCDHNSIPKTITLLDGPQSVYSGTGVNCYYGNGVIYYGPQAECTPSFEYTDSIDIEMINEHTYLNALKLEPLPLKSNGIMFYYSIIGISNTDNKISHLSSVHGVLAKYKLNNDVYTEVEYCNDIETPVWTPFSSKVWSDGIIKVGYLKPTGGVDDIPVVEEVPEIDGTQITFGNKDVVNRNFMTLEIPNPWQLNNKTYNFRKLKAFRIRHYDSVSNTASRWSVPNYQSLLPVSIEMMTVFVSEDPVLPSVSDINNPVYDVYQIIRKEGIYYDRKTDKALGMNKYNIPLGEHRSVFSETSKQEKIKIQIPALYGKTYNVTVYLTDVYGNTSEPSRRVVRS